MKTTLFLGALAAPSLLWAQNLEVAAATLSEVVITATRTPVAQADALAAVTVIPRERIERAQVTDVAELLRFEAGIDLGRNGGPGTFTSAFIRGGESNHTLVLIDGVRVNPATSGGAALQNIAPGMIERIEIVRGPRSTLYGSDAIGGVINIITRLPDAPQAGVTLRGGEENTRDIAAHLGYGDDDSHLGLQVQRQLTDGIPSCIGGTEDRGYDNTSVNLRGEAQISERVGVAARFWNAQGNAQYVSFCGAGGEALDQDFQNRTAAVELRLRPAAAWSTTLTLSRGEDDIRQNQANFLGAKDSVRTVRPMADWHNVVQAGGAHRLSFGLSAAREDVQALTFGTPIEEERDIYTGFVQDEVTLGRHRLSASANVADYEGFGTQVNWNLDYGFDLFTATRLIASAGTGFRAPDATDRYGFGGNPDLDPEQATNYELGLRQTLGAHQVVDLRAFHSEVDDLINLACDASFNCVAVNVDEYRNRGAELSWRYQDSAWSAGLTGIVQKPENRQTGDILPRRAKRSATARLTRLFSGGHYAGFEVLGSGERTDPAGPLGGYALLNLTAGAQFGKHVRLQARVENVLDKDYVTAGGYGQPGTTAYVTLGYSM